MVSWGKEQRLSPPSTHICRPATSAKDQKMRNLNVFKWRPKCRQNIKMSNKWRKWKNVEPNPSANKLIICTQEGICKTSSLQTLCEWLNVIVWGTGSVENMGVGPGLNLNQVVAISALALSPGPVRDGTASPCNWKCFSSLKKFIID